MTGAVQEHYRATPGTPDSVDEAGVVEDVPIAVMLWRPETNEFGVYFYATAGASAIPLPGLPPTHRVEFFIGLTGERPEVVPVLASLGTYAGRTGAAVTGGDTMMYPEPLWPGTRMNSVLIRSTDEEYIPVYRSDAGIHVEFLQVVPLFPEEYDYAVAHGTEDLVEHWATVHVPFRGPDRQPYVP